MKNLIFTLVPEEHKEDAMEQDIFIKVKRIISEELGIPKEKITLESRLTEDLGLDDIQLAEAALVLEEHFGIEISNDDFHKIKTVEQAVRTIQSLLTTTPNREVVERPS